MISCLVATMPAHLKSSSDDDEQSLMEYVYEQLHDQFIENIPIAAILELPPFFLYLFGAIAELLMLLTFISFFKSVYTQGMTQKFISITNDTGICEPVERSITGDFWGDTNGNWAGSADFSASLALYELILTDAKFSPTTYQTVMLMSYAALLRLGEAGKKQDLAANIAVLISWQMICRDVEDQFTASQNAVCNEFADSQQLFVFTAYSDNVFDIDSSIAALSDIQDTCNSSSFTSFDIGSRQTVATFVYSDYTANPNCARIAGPSNFGYNYDVDDNEFRISFDVRTFGDSVGINLGYLSSYDLEVVGHSPSVTFEFQGVSYLAQSFIDTAYVGMDPLYCITNQTEILDMSKGLMELCFMQLSTVFGIPLFNHYGNAGGNPTGMQSPQQCLCKPAPYGYGFEEYCDQFDLLTGVLFYQNQTMGLTQIEQMQAGIAAVLKNGNYSTLNSISYNATFAAAAIASNPSSVIDPQMHTDVWRSEAYSFCDVDVFGSCSLYVVRSFGDSLTDSSTTPFLYQLVNGSCGDPFGVPAPVFQQLVDNPPTPITESYYQCTLTEYDAVNNAVGIASGITTTIVPIAVMLLLPFIYLWLKAFNIPLPVPEYSEQQKKDVVDFFFTQLMRANDYKTRGMKKNGVLLQLVAELRHADKYGSKEAYDSDDSDEDYSDDEAGGGFGKGKDEELGKINHLSTSSAAWIKPPERRVSDRGFLNSETRNQLAEETNPLHIVKRRLSILAPQTDEEVFAAEIVKGKLAVSCCSNEILDVSLEEFIVTFIEDSSLYSLAV